MTSVTTVCLQDTFLGIEITSLKTNSPVFKNLAYSSVPVSKTLSGIINSYQLLYEIPQIRIRRKKDDLGTFFFIYIYVIGAIFVNLTGKIKKKSVKNVFEYMKNKNMYVCNHLWWDGFCLFFQQQQQKKKLTSTLKSL